MALLSGNGLNLRYVYTRRTRAIKGVGVVQRGWQMASAGPHATLRVTWLTRSVVRLVGSALVVAALAVVVSGCAQREDESPLMSLRRDLPANTTLRLPSTAPPALVDAAISSGDGTSIVSFYSLDEPIVSVCQAAPEPCLRLMPTAQVIPRADSQTGVTVLIEAQETGVDMALSEELRRFWSEVELVAGRPDWLGSR